MKKEALRIDAEEAKERFCGIDEVYERFLRLFPEEEEFERLRRAMAEENYSEAYFLAHTLKGTAGNLSLNLLLEQLRTFTNALREPPDPVKAKQLLPGVEEEYRRTVEEIRLRFCK